MSAKRARRPMRAQAIAEFALILPIFVLMLMGVFDLGRAVFIYNGLTNAAREGARLAMVNQDKALVAQRVQASTIGGALSNSGDLNDLVRYHRSTPNADVLTNPACAPVTVGCIAVVIPRSNWTLLTPVLSSVVGPIAFQARSELPIEFVCPNASIPAYATSAGCPKQP